jgi:hypothetical protein
LSISAQNPSPHVLLTFKVSVDKSGVILMGLPLHVIWFCSSTDFNILSLYSVLVVLMIICFEEVLFLPSLFGILEISCS